MIMFPRQARKIPTRHYLENKITTKLFYVVRTLTARWMESCMMLKTMARQLKVDLSEYSTWSGTM